MPLHAALLVEVQVRTVQFRAANVGAEFTDDDRVALVHVVRLHLGKLFLRMYDASELGIHRACPGVVARVALGFASLGVVAVVVLRLNGFACTPVLLARHKRVLVRIVVMHFEHQAAFDLVFREGAYRSVCDRFVDVGVQALNNQGAGFVVATGGTHCVDKGLVVVHESGHMLRCPRIHIRAGFVGACKHQALVVVLELVRNLRPVSLHLVVNRLVDTCTDVALEPAAFTFVVNVQNRVEACAHGVVDHRFHGVKPSFGDLAATGVAVPSAGNSDRIESCCLHGIEQSLSRVGVAP